MTSIDSQPEPASATPMSSDEVVHIAGVDKTFVMAGSATTTALDRKSVV